MTLVLSSGAPILQLDDVIAEHRHAGALLTPTPRVLAPSVALAGFQRQAHANRARSNIVRRERPARSRGCKSLTMKA
jgi:hypothetical protein